MTVMSTLAISGLVGSVLAANFTSSAPINMTDLPTHEAEEERRLSFEFDDEAEWMTHRKMFGDETECRRLATGVFREVSEEECRDLCTMRKDCNAINYAKREKLCDLRDCDEGAEPMRLHNKFRAQWLSDWGDSVPTMSRYIGCFENRYGARQNGHVLKTWEECEEMAMRKGKTTFGMECPQCTSVPGQAQCLLLEFHQYDRMQRRPDQECNLETANGRMMGNAHRLAVYEMSHADAWHLAPEGAASCDYGENAPQAKCQQIVAELAREAGKTPGRSLQVGRSNGHCMRGWGAVPEGCSAQSGGDWAAHFNLRENAPNCVHPAYQLVCSGSAASGSGSPHQGTPTAAPTTIPSVMPTPMPFPRGRDPALVRNNLDRMVSMGTGEFTLRFYITPKGTVNGWSNIVHLTRWNNNIESMGSRHPGVWFHARSTRLHVCAGCDGNRNTCLNTEALPMHRETSIAVMVKNGMFKVLTLNGGNRVMAETRCSRPFNPNNGRGYLYASDPWYTAADAEISHLLYWA